MVQICLKSRFRPDDKKTFTRLFCNSIVVFSPKGNPEENQVGLFNVTSSIFSTVEITNIEHNENNWVGSATVGTKVIFGPQLQDSVGIFDVVASTFSTIATTGDAYNVTGYVENDQVMGFNNMRAFGNGIHHLMEFILTILPMVFPMLMLKKSFHHLKVFKP